MRWLVLAGVAALVLGSGVQAARQLASVTVGGDVQVCAGAACRTWSWGAW